MFSRLVRLFAAALLLLTVVGLIGAIVYSVNPPPPPMETYEHPTLGTLCYPWDWTVATVAPDRFFIADPTGQVLAGYRLWDREMGTTPDGFIDTYYAQKPDDTVIEETAPASLGGLPSLSTTFTYWWGVIEIINVAMLDDQPVKLFMEGPPTQVTGYMDYYVQMASCCQFPGVPHLSLRRRPSVQ